jgi:biotin-dependent carboxylase-like uncharacterized protein
MSLTVLAPGLLSSFQDLGRHGHQHLGVPVGGAMDERAHRLANLLAGNPESEATLEITLLGPRLRIDAPCCLAVCGADLQPTLDGRPLPNNRPIVARAGEVLKFGPRRQGARAYLAVHGGFALEPVLGSRSTNLRGRYGGYQGRALAAGDLIRLGRKLADAGLEELARELWNLRIYLPSSLGAPARPRLRALRGEHAGLFKAAAVRSFYSAPFRISPQSERMGYRLQGPQLELQRPRQLLSEATCFGTVQVPAEGQPIVLMADRQTTGGYPKIAHVASVDLPLLAQSLPGDTVGFEEIDIDAAQRLDARREAACARLQQALAPLRALLESAHADAGAPSGMEADPTPL